MYLCHTHFSLRYGVLAPQRLVKTAAEWGVRTLCLTDINNTSCAGEFVEWCHVYGIKPVLGIEFRRDGRWLYTGLARGAEGWQALNRFLIECSLQGRSNTQPLPAKRMAPAAPHQGAA